MAYYYFDQNDHVDTLHNSDVYLIGQSQNYHDDNFVVPRIWEGWNIADGYSITLGGTSPAFSIEGKPDDLYKAYNIYQEKQTGIGHSTKSPFADMVAHSAVDFTGDGTVNFTSQTGATTSHHDDRDIYVIAKNKSTSFNTMIDEKLWGLDGDFWAHSDPFPTSDVDTDSTGFRAKKTLTLNTAVNGTVEAHSRAYSHGVLKTSNSVITNTANNMSNVASGFRGDSIVFKNNIYGNIISTTRVDFKSAASRNMSGNTVGAYGYLADNNINAAKSMWAGQIKAQANNSILDGSYAVDKDGKSLDGGSNVSNNKIQAMGVSGNNVTIKIIDSSMNGTHSAGDIKSQDLTSSTGNEKISLDGGLTYIDKGELNPCGPMEIYVTQKIEEGKDPVNINSGFKWTRKEITDPTELANTTFVIKYSYKGEKYTVNKTIEIKGDNSSLTYVNGQYVYTASAEELKDLEKLVKKPPYEIFEVTDLDLTGLTGVYDKTTASYTMTFYATQEYMDANKDKFKLQFDMYADSILGGDSRDVDFSKLTFKPDYSSSFFVNGKIYYKYEATSVDPSFQVLETLDKNKFISAEVINNKILSTRQGDNGNGMSNNIIEAVGINAKEKLVINKVTKDSIIEVTANNNEIIATRIDLKCTIMDNEHNAIGIRAKEMTLNNFAGTIVVTANNNKNSTDLVAGHYDYVNHVGIVAESLSSNTSLHGKIEVNSSNNNVVGGITESTRGDVLKYSKHVGGVYAETSMSINGMISSTITVNSIENGSMLNFGIYSNGNLRAQGFNGSITVNLGSLSSQMTGGWTIGIYANEFISSVGDTFNFNGSITVSGVAGQLVGIASRETMNIALYGTVTVAGGFAIKGDYGRDTATGFNDDIVELMNGSKTTGNINLGGGLNTVYINSGAKYTGFIDHDVATTNVVFNLNAVSDTAIATINSLHDVSLSSGTTITINVNNAEQDKNYILYQYTDGAAANMADKHWSNANVTISYLGNTYILKMDNYKGWISISDTQYLYVTYDSVNNTLSTKLTGKPEHELAKTLSTVNFDKDGNITIANGSTDLLNAYIKSLNLIEGEKYEDRIIKYNPDSQGETISSNVTLNWMGDAKNFNNNEQFEIVYTIFDETGKALSTKVLRVGSNGSKVGEFSFDGKNYFSYSYTINNLPAGYSIDWKVRDYIGGGSNVTDWIGGNTVTTKPNIPFGFKDIENMTGINPDDITQGINSGIVKLTWNQVNSVYAVENYTVRYFTTDEDLSSEEQKAIREELFGIVDSADKNIKDTWQNIDGSAYQVCIYTNGEIKIRIEDTSKILPPGEKAYKMYNFYQKTVSANELLISGITSQTYVYWQVMAQDVYGNFGKWNEGVDFRAYLGDNEGPTFKGTPVLYANGNKPTTYDMENQTYNCTDFRWFLEGSQQNTADDSKSGVRRYVLRYQEAGSTVWKTLKSFDAKFLFNADGTWKNGMDFSFNIPGIYKIRIDAVDAAGNYGQSSKEFTVVAQDIVGPVAVPVHEYMKNVVKNGKVDGFHYDFTWSATVDAPASGTTISTGINEYKIKYNYIDKEGKTKTFNNITVVGIGADGLQYKITTSVDKSGVITINGADLGKYTGYILAAGYFDETTGEFIYETMTNDNRYFLNITVTDKAGNSTTLVDKELTGNKNVDITPPDGSYGTLKKPTVTVTKREGGTTVTPPTENPGTGEGGEPTAPSNPTLGKPLEANVTFTWEDDYSDEQNDVRYIVQVGKDDAFFANEVFTILVVDLKDDPQKISAMYEKLKGTYQNLMVVNVNDITQKTLVVGNGHLSVPVGMFSGLMDGKWRVKAVDTAGNEALKWSGSSEFSFVDPETGKVIVDTGVPAKAYEFVLDKTYNKETGLNTGELNYSFKVNNEGFGISYFVVKYNSKGGDNGSVKIPSRYILSKDGSTGNMTILSGSLVNSFNQYFKDGNYSITISSYGPNGKTNTSSEYKFVQDTVAPSFSVDGTGKPQGFNGDTDLTVSFLTSHPNENGEISAYVSWKEASDLTSGVDHYILRYRVEGGKWQELKVNGTGINLTLSLPAQYEMEVIAVDKTGNKSTVDKTWADKLEVKDIDPDKPYVYDPLNPIKGQTVGSIDNTDKSDRIVVKTLDDVGEMQITIKNLRSVYKAGSGLTLKVFDANGREIKKFNVTLNANSKSLDGQTIRILFDPPVAGDYTIEVSSTKDGTIMQYDLTYNYDKFTVVDIDDIAIYTSNVLTDTGLAESGRVGYDDKNNFYKFSIDADGKYSFDLKKTDGNIDTTAGLNFYIYKVMPGSTKLTLVKSFKISSNQLSGELKDLLLSAGDYYIQIESPNANKGANIKYDLTCNPNKYTSGNNADDFFANLDDNYQVDVIGREFNDSGFQYIIGDVENSEWVGYGDMVDFREITFDTAGNYTFNINKDLTTELGKTGNNGQITLTLYQFDSTKLAMTKVKSITVKAGATTPREFTLLLQSGTYYIGISADNANKGDSIYYDVTVEGESFVNAAGNQNLVNALDNVITVTSNGSQKFSNTNYIGFGEENNFFSLNLQGTADLTFDLVNKNGANASGITLTVYKYNATGNGLAVVKTITVKAGATNANTILKGLAAGNYIVKVTSSDASKGKYSDYEVNLKTENYVGSVIDLANNSNFLNAEAIEFGVKVERGGDTDLINYYKFNTGVFAGEFKIAFNPADTSRFSFNLYTLQNGKLVLSKVVSGLDITTYLESNTTYYIEVNTNKNNPDAAYDFTVNNNGKDISTYLEDNNFAKLDEKYQLVYDNVAAENAPGLEYDSWAGFGDMVSFRKLSLSNGGSFSLTLDKADTEAALASGLTITLFKLNANGTSLVSYKTLTVKAGVDLASLNDILLDAGDYYIQVKSTTKFGSADFNVSMDDKFLTQYDDNNTYDKAESITITDETVGWVGYGDEFDYFRIEAGSLSESGDYTFSVKGSDTVKINLYIVNPTNSSLVLLKSISISAKDFNNEINFTQMLDKNSNYIFSIQSTNAKKGGNADYTIKLNGDPAEYVRVVEDGTGSVEIKDAAKKEYATFSITTNSEGKYSFKIGDEDLSEIGLASGVKLYKYNQATGKYSVVNLDRNKQVDLTAGDYYFECTGGVGTEFDFKFGASDKTIYSSIIK